MTRFTYITSICRLAAGLLPIVSIIACESPVDLPPDGQPQTPVPVASVEIQWPAAELDVGDVVTFGARVLAADHTVLDRPVTWKSSDAQVASVSAAGVVTARGVGQAWITAAVEGREATAMVTIRAGAPALVTRLQPASVPAGSPAFELTIHGTGFQHGATVLFSGEQRQTRLISDIEIRIEMSAEDVRHPGGIEVRVYNPGQTAGTLNYFVVERMQSTTSYDLIGVAYNDVGLPVLTGAFFQNGDLTRYVEQHVTAGVLRIHERPAGSDQWELTLTMTTTSKQGELLKEENLIFFGNVETMVGGQRALRSAMFPNIVLHTVERHDGELLVWQTLHPSGDDIHVKVWRYQPRQ